MQVRFQRLAGGAGSTARPIHSVCMMLTWRTWNDPPLPPLEWLSVLRGQYHAALCSYGTTTTERPYLSPPGLGVSVLSAFCLEPCMRSGVPGPLAGFDCRQCLQVYARQCMSSAHVLSGRSHSRWGAYTLSSYPARGTHTTRSPSSTDPSPHPRGLGRNVSVTVSCVEVAQSSVPSDGGRLF
jgi:hypothetical protein